MPWQILGFVILEGKNLEVGRGPTGRKIEPFMPKGPEKILVQLCS
jgi:hypothetical protein